MGILTDNAIWEAETEGLALLDLTIGDLLDNQATAFSDTEALVYNYPEIGLDLRLTFREYQAEANRVAKGLMALGIEPGEHLAIWATNVGSWVVPGILCSVLYLAFSLPLSRFARRLERKWSHA